MWRSPHRRMLRCLARCRGWLTPLQPCWRSPLPSKTRPGCRGRRWALSRWMAYGVAGALIVTLWGVGLSRSVQATWSASTPTATPTATETAQGSDLPSSSSSMSQGRSLYDQGRYAEAATVLEEAAADYRSHNRPLWEAVALSNLSLTYQALGQWPQAEAAIARSLELLAPLDQTLVETQALDVKGQLQFSLGQFEAAIDTWQRVGDRYDSLNQSRAYTQNIINRASALQALGFYRRAIDLLEQQQQQLQDQPPSLLHAAALRSLGDAYQVTGEFDAAATVLDESLAIAQSLQRPIDLAAIYLSLGNLAYSRGTALQNRADRNSDQMTTYFQQAADAYSRAAESSNPATQAQVRLNQLKVAIALNDHATLRALISTLSNQLDRLPPNRTNLFAHINFAKTLISLSQTNRGDSLTALRQDSMLTLIEQHLTTAYRQAQILGDARATAFALGTLGELYEITGDLRRSQALSEEALVLAQQLNASDMSYVWQWQLGRVYKAQNEREKAIAAYRSAIDTLQLLRKDLVAVNPDIQFAFRESIEPLHRELVSLLLDPDIDPTPADLETARTTIESLQLAELDNFFREACLDAREVQIDEVDRRAAVIYPIILDDRLEVILSLPEEAIATPETSAHAALSGPSDPAAPAQLLRRHSVLLSGGGDEMRRVANELTAYLKSVRSQGRVFEPAQTLYSWIIEPFEDDLQRGEIKTLVFVLDGVLRNVPMSVLYDGERYLIETYSIALTPSLQLLEASPLQPQQLNILLGGLSEARQEFPPLPGVEQELNDLQELAPDSRRLLNDQFTDEALKAAINNVPFPVVHLATHGEFSSNLDDTFILTWEDRLDINELNQLLQATELGRRQPIELLVLSACKTAEGDDRAALGLAGMAVRAGARSTVATLWQFQDEVAPLMMNRFYQELKGESVTKAEALRQAQLSILENPNYRDPYYWSLIVLVGNWL